VEGRAAQGRRDSETLAQELLVTAVPIVEAGERTGAVRVSQSVAAVDAKVRRDVLALAAIAAAALAVGLVLAWFLAGSLARPLRALAGTARRLAADDHEARAEVAGSAEQRELAVAFNDMTDRLTRVLDAQRQFVANASHQLRTPLTGLRLRLEAAAAKADDPALAYELAAAERETERLARLLAGLLTLAREGADRPRLTAPLSLTDAAERALERWQQQADHERHPLVLDTHGPATAWITDEDAAILLDNLIENALKYTPPGGTITVGTRSDARSALLVVLDEGPGIEPDEAERVFERFGRGSAAAGVQGTGLGLTIVRTLAQRWGGDATIGNRPEGGARVEVELPAERLPTPNPPLGEALPAGP
jgi:signal transduction histidine kinase